MPESHDPGYGQRARDDTRRASPQGRGAFVTDTRRGTRRERHAAETSGRPPHHGWSRIVSMMKVLLPVTALMLIAVVVAWSQFKGSVGDFTLGFSAIKPEDAKTLRMVNARYAGKNDKEEPYLLTAEQAVQDQPDDDVIRLVNPKGDLTSQGGTWTAVNAPGGFYRQETQLLDLHGGVQMFFDNGLEFTSPTAHINLERNIAMGDDPVYGHGPDREIAAEGFRLLDDGKRIIFTGKSKLTLYPTGTKGRGNIGGTGQ